MIISRLRLADHETMAIETLHVRESLVPGLSAADLEQQSFYEILQERYGIEIVGGLQTIEPTVTNEDESDALGVPLHSPAFLFERTTRAANGEIVEYVRSIYRGDRYRLVTELNRGPPAVAARPRDDPRNVTSPGTLSRFVGQYQRRQLARPGLACDRPPVALTQRWRRIQGCGPCRKWS